MKFTDGNWLVREGFELHFPAEVYSLERSSNSVSILAPCKRIRHRGDTLDGPLLSIKLSAPMADVIRVEISHFQGVRYRGPEFEVQADADGPFSVTEDEKFVTVSAGALSARVNKADWSLDFVSGGQRITGSGWRGMAYIKRDDGTTYVREQLDLGVGECVYGLGERFTAFVKNGQEVDIWNRDGGTSSEQAYKNVPFYMTNRGYGVFVNHPECVSFEVGTERVSRVQFSVPGEYLNYYLIYGPTPKEVLEKYTALTGRPALPPAWSFGLWLTTSFTTNYDEQTVTEFVEGMAQRDIPLHVFHFDCFWMKAFHWCDFQWDRTSFPDPEGMLQRLKARGLRICVWINPYVAQCSALFEEGAKKGYFIRKPNGDVWQWDLWQPGMAIVDFTNPAACEWYKGQLKRLMRMGVDCFKADFGERIPTDVVYFDGSDPVKMHNYYSPLYNKAVFEAIEEELGKGSAVLFSRSATVGGQRFPVHWGGDCYATYPSMAESLRGGLSLCLSGFGFWSHDIGGFEDTATPDLYKRWVAFGLLSSHSRLHGSKSYRVPWLFDEEAVDVLRYFTKLKCRLMPYIYKAACEAAERGIPVMRAMMLEFPDDPGCDYLDRQYMLGESLLVAPVFDPDGRVSYYLPEGKWTSFLTNRIVEGGRWVKEVHDYFSLPLMVRENSIIPVGAVEDRPDYDYTQGITFHVFELQDGQTTKAEVPNLRGKTAMAISVQRVGRRYSVRAYGEARDWSIILRNVCSLSADSDIRWEREPLGVRITPSEKLEFTFEVEDLSTEDE
ncbi:MAG TPA: alpha-xylosidase [Firmicutes bacterium]|nr:alpha-xylosidase [Bacillota bacterium]